LQLETTRSKWILVEKERWKIGFLILQTPEGSWAILPRLPAFTARLTISQLNSRGANGIS
jgi:hypothetical protein